MPSIKYNNIKSFNVVFVASLLMFLLHCEENKPYIVQGTDNIIYSSSEADGNVTGFIFDQLTKEPLAAVKVLIMAKGKVFKTLSSDDGAFNLEMSKTLMGDGYSVHFQKEGYENASRAALVRLANRQVAVEDVYMKPQGLTSNQEGEL